MEFAKIASDPTVSAAFAAWAQAAFTLMALVAVGVAVWQMRADHDRSRKELSLKLGADWISYQNHTRTAAIHILAKLNEDDTASLLGKQPFSIDRKYEPELRDALQRHPLPDALSSDRIHLDREQVVELRSAIVDYLNQLEVVFSAWKSGVADRDMIEEEFVYLMEKSNYLGEHFRQAAWGDWPAIHEFVRTWRDKKYGSSGVAAPLVGANEAGSTMAAMLSSK